MRRDMCAHRCICAGIYMSLDMCTDMCAYMCTAMCIDMCADTYVYGHVGRLKAHLMSAARVGPRRCALRASVAASCGPRNCAPTTLCAPPNFAAHPAHAHVYTPVYPAYRHKCMFSTHGKACKHLTHRTHRTHKPYAHTSSPEKSFHITLCAHRSTVLNVSAPRGAYTRACASTP